MKNIEVIENFIGGVNGGKTANLYQKGDSLINYSTVIARRINGKIYLNNEKYSQTTSTIQNKIRKSTPSRMLVEVNSNEILRITEQKEQAVKLIVNVA